MNDVLTDALNDFAIYPAGFIHACCSHWRWRAGHLRNTHEANTAI